MICRFGYRLTIDLQLVQTNSRFLFDYVKNGSGLVADSLEGGPSDMRRGTVLRESDDHSTGIGVPVPILFGPVSQKALGNRPETILTVPAVH